MKNIIAFLKFSFERLNKPNKVLFFSIALTSALTLAAAVIVPMLQKDIISKISISTATRAPAFLMLLLSLISIFCSVFEILSLNRLNVNLRIKLQQELLGSVLRRGSKVVSTRGEGAYFNTLFGDTERISELLSTNYFNVAFLCIANLVIAIIAAQWSWIFLAIVIPIYILTALITVYSNKMYMKHYTAFRELVVKINPKVLEYIENRVSLLGFANLLKLEKDLTDEISEREAYIYKATSISLLSKTFVTALKAIGLVVFFLLVSNQIRSGDLDIGAFIAMLTYYAGVFAPISAIQSLSEGMRTYELHYGRLKDDLYQEPEIGLPSSYTLKLVNCSFSYKTDENDCVSGFTLDVDKRIGLVGLSGEGKTTIIKILMGILSPGEGECILGGKPVTSIARSVLYSSIRLYGQDLELFNESLEYNITLGKNPVSQSEYEAMVTKHSGELRRCVTMLNMPNYTDTDCEIFAELLLLDESHKRDSNILARFAKEISEKESMLSTFAEILVARKYYISERYNSIISDLGITHLEGRALGQHGGKVSGGEKNKICLARFLLPVNKAFYILDEPLTSVDSISEEQCLAAIAKYLVCEGGITISHKLNLTRALSDEVVLLRNGKVEEQGTHEELMKNTSHYYDMYNKFVELHGNHKK